MYPSSHSVRARSCISVLVRDTACSARDKRLATRVDQLATLHIPAALCPCGSPKLSRDDRARCPASLPTVGRSVPPIVLRGTGIFYSVLLLHVLSLLACSTVPQTRKTKPKQTKPNSRRIAAPEYAFVVLGGSVSNAGGSVRRNRPDGRAVPSFCPSLVDPTLVAVY